MMRIAGRDSSGLAKAIKTDSNGNIGVETINQLKQELGAGGKNLFDLKSVLNDVLLGSNGLPTTGGTGWSTSDYCIVKPSETVVISKAKRIAEYDLNKNFIPGSYREISETPFTWTTTNKTRYVKFSDYSGNGLKTIQLEYGNTPTPFENYKESLYMNGLKYSELVTSSTENSGSTSSEIQALDAETKEPVSLFSVKRNDGSNVLLVADASLPDSAHAFPISSGNTNVQGVTPNPSSRLVGFSITGGESDSQVRLFHGTGTNGIELFDLKITANQSIREWFDMGGISTPNGIYVQRVSGSPKMTLFARLSE